MFSAGDAQYKPEAQASESVSRGKTHSLALRACLRRNLVLSSYIARLGRTTINVQNRMTFPIDVTEAGQTWVVLPGSVTFGQTSDHVQIWPDEFEH